MTIADRFLPRFVIPCSIVALALNSFAWAEQVEFSSSLNPVGSGARAVGMGGAFISVADDATAASWNPAGLVQLEWPELSAVFQYFHRRQAYHSVEHPELETTNSMDASGLNYASAVYPFVFRNRNMTLSINYQRLFDLNKNIDATLGFDAQGEPLLKKIRFTQEGYLYALSPACALEVSPRFSLGLSVNFWDEFLGDNGWKDHFRSVGDVTLGGSSVILHRDRKDDISFQGMNAHLGFLWNIFGRLTLGGVIKTPFDADLTRTTTVFYSEDWSELGTHNESTSSRNEELVLAMPASYGLGLSYRFTDAWMVSFDVYRTDWSNFEITDSQGTVLNPITSRPIGEGRLEDTTQVRLGTEYLFIRERDVIAVRGGIFYDPEPAVGSPDDFCGLSISAGYVRGRVALDAAYQYRTADRATGDVPSVKDSSADIDQHVFMVSGIVYF